MTFKPKEAESLTLIMSNTQNCVIGIKSWMMASMYNQVLVLMNINIRNPITINKIKIDSIDISTASSVRNLGDAIFGFALSFEAFVNSIF